MNANASDAADNLAKASREAAADYRQRSAAVKGFASDEARAFLSDVEDLVKKVANVSDAEIARVRVKVANALGDMRRVAGETADNLRERARVTIDATNDYVHDRPWTAIGVAAAVGLLIGIGVSAASRGRD